MVQSASDVGQNIVPSLVSARVKVPVIIRWPKLVGRDELLQAVNWRQGFIVAFLRRRAARRAISIAEPIIRWAPDIGTEHVNTAPEAVSLCHRVHDGILPV